MSKKKYLEKMLVDYTKSGMTPKEFMENYNNSKTIQSFIDYAVRNGISCYNDLFSKNISLDKLMLRVRQQDYINFKEMLVYYLYFISNLTLKEIADYFNNTHANIIHLRDKATHSDILYEWYRDELQGFINCLNKKIKK